MDIDKKFFEEYEDNEDMSCEKAYSEFIPFLEEIHTYKDNILKCLMDLIGKEISKLPETQREVLYAYYFSGKTLKQIGIDLNLTEDAVRLRKHRAILTLRKHLTNNPYVVELYNQFKKEDPPISLILDLSKFIKKY